VILHTIGEVTAVRQVAENVFVLSFTSATLSSGTRPGQFLNIKVAGGTDPLLRRPFSVYRTEGDQVELIFNVVGKGTSAMHAMRPGDRLDILGPLGRPFSVDEGGFETALLVGGGLGVAPLPITTAELRKRGKKVVTFLGARSASQVVDAHLADVHIATDDGSRGFRGTVVDLLADFLTSHPVVAPKIFACGPTPMLKALALFALSRKLPCEVSLEGPMACGIGICQGCPVELAGQDGKYALMCKEGPAFPVEKIKWD